MKSNPHRRYSLLQADKAWGEYAHNTFTSCAINNRACCGSLEAHHIIRRSAKSTRHSPHNLIMLCAYHHRGLWSAHNKPRWFMAWLTENRPEQAAWVEENRWKIVK